MERVEGWCSCTLCGEVSSPKRWRRPSPRFQHSPWSPSNPIHSFLRMSLAENQIGTRRDVVKILTALPRLGQYVFAGQKAGKPLSDIAMACALRYMNRTASDQPLWVDPKSGCAPSPLMACERPFGPGARMWVSPRELLEEALGHQIGTAVERAYRAHRQAFVERRRTVMQAWADFCCGRPFRAPMACLAAVVGRAGEAAFRRVK